MFSWHGLFTVYEPPEKIPFKRPMDQWLSDWGGPKREEFISGCIDNMKGDQKWLVYCLEWFLNLMDKGELDER